jgi:hypothetical protein
MLAPRAWRSRRISHRPTRPAPGATSFPHRPRRQVRHSPSTVVRWTGYWVRYWQRCALHHAAAAARRKGVPYSYGPMIADTWKLSRSAEEAPADQPLQPPPHLARPGPPQARPGSVRGLRVAGGSERRGNPDPAAAAQPGAGRRRLPEQVVARTSAPIRCCAHLSGAILVGC